MRALSNMSIRRKQMVIIMFTSTVSLLLACAIFVAYDVLNFRKELVKKVSVLAQAIGNNCTAAVEYDTPQVAEDTLSALRAESSIVSACIYTKKGDVFATYHRTNAVAFTLPAWQVGGYEFKGNFLYLFRPIVQDGESIGTIFVASARGC